MKLAVTGSKMQVVVQMVRMEKNWNEVADFTRFWQAAPGVDEVRIKADETDLMRPDAAHAAGDWTHPCHYLWRGAMYVKHSGDVYPCCQSYNLGGAPVGNVNDAPLPEIFNSPEMHLWHHVHASAGPINRNFGVTLSVWDWLFGTAYMPGHAPARLGFTGDESHARTWLGQTIEPFRAWLRLLR